MDNPELNKLMEDLKNFKLETQEKVRKTVWDKYVKIVYWLEKSERFYLRQEHGSWIAYSEKYLRQLLKGAGFFDWITEPDLKLWKAQAQSFWEAFLNHIINHNALKGAGLVGGRCEGLLEYGNEKYLITGSPKIINPVQGDCTFIVWYLKQLLPEPQLDHFLAWMRLSYLSLIQQLRSFGQVLFLVGPAQCGKSLLQVRLITPILGGRSAEPFTYMTGQTHFNSDLIKADHLHIEDQGVSHRQFDRHKFEDFIKITAVGTATRAEAKGQDAFMVYPIRRMTVSLNGESYNFETIPDLSESLVDKIMIFNCGTVDFGIPSSEIEAMIEKELPAFIFWFMNEWKCPEEILTEDRMGVNSYIDPSIREKLEGFSPETRTKQMLDVYLNEGAQQFIQGNATDIWGMLNASTAAKGLLLANCRTVDWLGRRLSAMQRKYPSRITELPRTGKDGTVYKILRNGTQPHNTL
jgi:hypothetical protein